MQVKIKMCYIYIFSELTAILNKKNIFCGLAYEMLKVINIFYIYIISPHKVFTFELDFFLQNEELNSVELVTRQKALMALCDVLHNPEYVKRSIQCCKCM